MACDALCNAVDEAEVLLARGTSPLDKMTPVQTCEGLAKTICASASSYWPRTPTFVVFEMFYLSVIPLGLPILWVS